MKSKVQKHIPALKYLYISSTFKIKYRFISSTCFEQLLFIIKFKPLPVFWHLLEFSVRPGFSLLQHLYVCIDLEFCLYTLTFINYIFFQLESDHFTESYLFYCFFNYLFYLYSCFHLFLPGLVLWNPLLLWWQFLPWLTCFHLDLFCGSLYFCGWLFPPCLSLHLLTMPCPFLQMIL